MLKGVFFLAAVVTTAGLIGLRVTGAAVSHSPVVLEGGVPAVVYEPPEAEARPPAVVLVHGFAGDAATVSTLARQLARAGYGVVTPELRGHGSHPKPIPRGVLGGDLTPLREDLDAAVLFARGSGRFDPERVALVGHSLGAAAALDYASTDPGIGAVVAMSGSYDWTGPYTPPNVLQIWASGDLAATKLAARRVGERLARQKQIVVDRFYGSLERGTGYKATEIDSESHASVLRSETSARRILDWLGRSIGPAESVAAPAVDDRWMWSALVGLGLGLLLIALTGVLRPEILDPIETPRPGRRALGLVELTVALGLATLVGAGTDPAVSRGPLAFLPFAGSREVLGVLLLAGAGLAACWALRDGLPLRAGLSVPAAARAALLFLPVYVLGGAAFEPFHSTWLAPHRLSWWPVTSALALPFFLGVEQRFRDTSRWSAAVWSISARLITLAALFAASFSGVLSLAALVVMLRVLILFVLFELLALRLVRTGPDPWTLALLQSAWLGWLLAASPLDTLPG